MKPILFTKENRAATRSGAKTQTRRVITDYLSTMPDRYTVGEVRYLCEPYVIDSAEHTSKRQVIGEYLDDGKPFTVTLTADEWDRFLARKQPYSVTQPRFMYKSLARTFVQITGLRREPLQKISEGDAQAEGVAPLPSPVSSPESQWRGLRYIPAFAALWNDINAHRGHGWKENPTVLVVEYKLTQSPSL